MCGLFGLIDYKGNVPFNLKERIIRELSIASEIRGTHATGIAYVYKNDIIINKAARAAHNMQFKLRTNPRSIIGHCRYTTQGSELKNENNHPFYSEKLNFAFAHNGVLYNDAWLRKNEQLPETDIETDSYVALQLIEKENEITFDSLSKMANKVKGSFCFTLLDSKNNVYFIKGNNPLAIVDCGGYYAYASTEAILIKGLHKAGIYKMRKINIDENEILKIADNGDREYHTFKVEEEKEKDYTWFNQYYGYNNFDYTEYWSKRGDIVW